MSAGSDWSSVIGSGVDAFRSVLNTVSPPLPAPAPKSTIGLGVTPGGVAISSQNIGAPTLILGAIAIIITVGFVLVKR